MCPFFLFLFLSLLSSLQPLHIHPSIHPSVYPSAVLAPLLSSPFLPSCPSSPSASRSHPLARHHLLPFPDAMQWAIAEWDYLATHEDELVKCLLPSLPSNWCLSVLDDSPLGSLHTFRSLFAREITF